MGAMAVFSQTSLNASNMSQHFELTGGTPARTSLKAVQSMISLKHFVDVVINMLTFNVGRNLAV